MESKEIPEVVYFAFYRVVRQSEPPSLKDFLKTKIKDTWPTGMSPSTWSDFWWEAVAVEIQSSALARGEYIEYLDGKWIKANQAKPWKVLIDHVDRNLVPVR